jgi:isocitrate dehydrogenase (NAD+)
MTYRLTLIEGDGIGPEVTGATVEVLAAAGAPIEWERVPAGLAAFDQCGDPLPDAVIESIRKNRVGLKGPLQTPKGGGYTSANVGLRKKLELFTGWRPVHNLPGLRTRHDHVDLVVLRENTEGLYSGIEHEVTPGTIVTLKVSSVHAGERIAKWAFEHARHAGRRKISVVHKRSVLPLADGAFVDAFHRVGQDYPFIEQDEVSLDDLCLGMVQDPEQYDVLLLQNLYGDIVSDLAAGLVGGLGVVPDIAGKGIANPLAVLMSSLLMLEHIGERRVADKVRGAIYAVLEEGRALTGDLGGSANTAEFTHAIIDRL